MGDQAFDNIVMEEAMFILPETIDKATSFHEEYCLKCNIKKNLKMRNDGYNYFFICTNCSC